MLLRNLKIGQKLTLAVSTLILLFVVSSVILFNILNNLHILQEELMGRNNDAIYVSNAEGIGTETYQVIADAIINQNKEESMKRWHNTSAENQEMLIKLKQIADTDEELLLIEKINKNYNQIVEIAEKQMFPLVFGSDSVDMKTTRLIDAEVDNLVGLIADDVHEYVDKIENESVEADAAFDAQLSMSYWIVGITIGVIVIISVIFIFVLMNMIVKPIQEGVEFAKKVAAGDLMAEVDIVQKDEIGILAESLRNMISQIKTTVLNVKNGANTISAASSGINNAASQLSKGAMEMNTNSQRLSQGASEQAASTEQVSSSMEEMAANIQQNTDNSRQAEKIALQVSQNINTVASKSKDSIEHITKIADKITIIGDIAFQTNILALNAAVEAARAGEHGKGFAVVAAEVRKLAERSKIAADEIDALSKSSVLVTKEAGELLNNIIPDIQNTSNLVQEITASSIEQNSGADQVNNAIVQLNEVTQQTSVSAEELASTAEEFTSSAHMLETNAEEMLQQSDMLLDAIAFFKTGNEEQVHSYMPGRQPMVAHTTQTVTSKQKEDITASSKHNTVRSSGVKLSMNESDSEFSHF